MSETNPSFSIDDILSEDAVVVMPPLHTQNEEPPVPADEAPAPKKKHRFLIGLGIYFGLLLVLIGVALWFLRGFLADYEASIPTSTLEQYVEWVRNKDYNSIYEHSDFEETAVNTRDEYIAYLENLYSGEPTQITLRERVSTQEDVREYSVYYDDERVSILLLSEKEENGNTRWQVTTKLVYREAFTLLCGADCRITVNGVDVSLLGLTPEEVQDTVFSGVTDTTVYPTVYQYTLTGLLNEPRIEATSLSGTTCEVTRDTSNPQIYRVSHPGVADEAAQLEQLAREVATTYAEFIAKDASRKDFLAYVYPNCTFYQAIRNFNNEWFNDHDAYEFRDIQVLNGFRYTDRDYTCEVTFLPVYTRKGQTISRESAHYRLAFLLLEDEWLLTSLTVVTDDAVAAEATADTSSTTGTTTVAG